MFCFSQLCSTRHASPCGQRLPSRQHDHNLMKWNIPEEKNRVHVEKFSERWEKTATSDSYCTERMMFSPFVSKRCSLKSRIVFNVPFFKKKVFISFISAGELKKKPKSTRDFQNVQV